MIIAIITIYNPSKNVFDNVIKISKQVDKVVLVDNSSLSHEIMFRGIENSQYYYMECNLGLPKAFNKVLLDNSMQWQDDDYVIFFDQDSSVAEKQVFDLKEAYDFLLLREYKVGAIGAAYINSEGNVEVPHIKNLIKNTCCYIVQDLITSSMLVKYNVLKQVEFWNENLFLDGADWDLCWRLRNAGYLCILKTDIRFQHSVGNGYRKISLIKIRDSAPIRNYYRTRDNLYLVKQKYTPTYLRLRLVIDVLIVNILRVLLLDNKIERLKYIIRGIKDFQRNVVGEYTG